MNIQKNKDTGQGAKHEINMRVRKEMNISGVVDIVSFDEEEVHLISDCGEIFIEGSGLHVDSLDTEKGTVVLSGKIDAVYYADETKKEKQGFFGKLFR